MVVAACAMADEQPTEKKWLPITLTGADSVRLTYADGLWVNYTVDDVSIAFFQSTRPVITSPEPVANLEAVCVARIVLPSRIAKHLRDVLVTVLPAHEEMQQRYLGTPPLPAESEPKK